MVIFIYIYKINLAFVPLLELIRIIYDNVWLFIINLFHLIYDGQIVPRFVMTTLTIIRILLWVNIFVNILEANPHPWNVVVSACCLIILHSKMVKFLNLVKRCFYVASYCLEVPQRNAKLLAWGFWINYEEYTLTRNLQFLKYFVWGNI